MTNDDKTIVKMEEGVEELQSEAAYCLETTNDDKTPVKTEVSAEEPNPEAPEGTCETAKPHPKTEASNCVSLNADEKPDVEGKYQQPSRTMSNQSTNDDVAEDSQKPEPSSAAPSCSSPVVTRRACVHLPRYQLTAVRPYCVFHEVHDCPEYRPGGNCYMLPPRCRIAQLQRGLAIRTGRLPPLPARHQHTARTFGRVRPKSCCTRPPADSCVAGLPTPDGTPLPAAHALPARRRLALPENVDIAQVTEVVLLTPAEPSHGAKCFAVRLRSGALVPVVSGTLRPGVPWRMEPADNVTVTAADRRSFRNARDRGCTAAVDVEDSPAELLRTPLTEVNRSLNEGRLLLTAAPDGGLALVSARMRVRCKERLRRVALGQRGALELFGTGSAVLMDNSGQLTVLGATAPDELDEDAAELRTEVEGASLPADDNLAVGAKPSVSDMSGTQEEDNDLPEVVSGAPGGVRDSQPTARKRAAPCEANAGGRKRQRPSNGVLTVMQQVWLAPQGSDGNEQRTVVVSSVKQPRNTNGKFLPMPKAAPKASGVAKLAGKLISGGVAKRVRNLTPAEEAKPVEKLIERTHPIINVTSVGATELAGHLTAGSVPERLGDVTYRVTVGKPAVAKGMTQPVGSQSAARATQALGSQTTGGTAKRARSMSATGLLMSVVQKIAGVKANPTKSRMSAEVTYLPENPTVGKAVVPPNCSRDEHSFVGRQMPKVIRFVPVAGGDTEAPRRLKLAFKPDTRALGLSTPLSEAFGPVQSATAPLKSHSSDPARKSDGDITRPPKLLRRAFLAESAPAAATPDSPLRRPKVRSLQRALSTLRRWRREGATPVGKPAADASARPACDPDRPKVRRKSWADLPASRQSWEHDSAGRGESEDPQTPRQRSRDNPSARQSWADPQAGRRNRADSPAVRRKSGDPQSACRNSGGHAASRRRSGDPQAARQNSGDHPTSRLSFGDDPAALGSPGDHPTSHRSSGDAPAVGRSPGDAPAVRRSTGDAPAVGRRPGDAPAARPSTGGAPAVGRRQGDAPAVRRSTGDAPAVRRRPGGAPVVRRSTGDAPAVGRRQGDAPAVRRSTGDAPAVGRRPEDAPAARQSTGGAPAVGRRQGDAPAVRRRPGDAPAARQSTPAVGRSPGDSRRPPALLRCDGVSVRRRSGGVAETISTREDQVDNQPAVVDLTTPEKAPPPRKSGLPLEVTLLNESDMSDDGLEDLDAAVPAPARLPVRTSKDDYCPDIQLIEL